MKTSTLPSGPSLLVWWGAMPVLMYVAWFKGVEGAQNVTVFLVWLMLFVAWGGIAGRKTDEAIRVEQIRPKWYQSLQSLTFILYGLIFAWQGGWGYLHAAGLMLSGALLSTLQDERREKFLKQQKGAGNETATGK